MRYEDMEYENFKNILEAVDELGTPSRATIAKHLSLSRTTVSNITAKLISSHVLIEANEEKSASSSRGRPGCPLTYDYSSWFALGASFYSSSWNFVICSLSGELVLDYVKEVEHVTPENLVSSLMQGIEHMLASFSGRLLPAIGLGVPGVTDSATGAILWAYDLKWTERIEIKNPVKKRFGFEVYCLNRYTLAGLAEYKYANPDGEKNMVYIGLGSGIRSAIFINGKLLEGASFSAGRLGHILVDSNGPVCECGKRGCLLAMANEEALVRNAYALASEPGFSDSPLAGVEYEELTSSMIIELAEKGDLCAREAMDHIIEPIIAATSILVDIINPKKIVLGGPIGYSSSYLVERVQAATDRIAMETPYRVMTIEQGKLKDIGAALGAAALVLEKKAELLYSRIK